MFLKCKWWDNLLSMIREDDHFWIKVYQVWLGKGIGGFIPPDSTQSKMAARYSRQLYFRLPCTAQCSSDPVELGKCYSNLTCHSPSSLPGWVSNLLRRKGYDSKGLLTKLFYVFYPKWVKQVRIKYTHPIFLFFLNWNHGLLINRIFRGRK